MQLKDERMRGANNQYFPTIGFLRQMLSFTSSLNADRERIPASARLMLLKGPGRASWRNTKIELEPRCWAGHDNASIQHEVCEVVRGLACKLFGRTKSRWANWSGGTKAHSCLCRHLRNCTGPGAYETVSRVPASSRRPDRGKMKLAHQHFTWDDAGGCQGL